MNTPQEMIEVIQGYIDGKEIEFKYVGCDDWGSAITPTFSFQDAEYRIKPQKKEGWVNVYTNSKLSDIYFPTKEIAVRSKGRLGCNYITTAKIEWEE